jgi:ADP-heptose:LPS heptosyltransferase
MKYQNILLVKLRAIGDSVLSLPSIQALRNAFPDARISVLVPEHSLQLFEADSRLDEVIGYSKRRLGVLAWRENISFYQALQERKFDLAICLHASFRTALLGWMSGAEKRSIRNHSGPDWFSNLKATEAKEAKSIIQRDFDALKALGIQPREEFPKLILSAKARNEAKILAKKFRLPQGKTVLIFPHAGKLSKEWPLERFQALKSALEKKRIRVVNVVAPGATIELDALRVPHLLSLGALCEFSGWAIGNDSGPRHIAAASGAKTFTLFGPEELREWQPYSMKDGHQALKSPDGTMESLEFDTVREAVFKWRH